MTAIACLRIVVGESLQIADADTMAEIIERTVLTPVGALRETPPDSPT